jgi:putative ABC transport system substrate-binding protein
MLVLSAILGLTACHKQNNNTLTIGIIEPIEHKAMNEIVDGYTKTLAASYDKPFIVKVENAQGDANLERAIIQKMHNAGYNIIAPIGVDATQMTLAVVHDKPVISLASDLTDAERHKLNPCNVAIVHDEIPANKIMAFILATYPHLTHLTLVHSAANKVFPEVNAAVAAGKQLGITVDHVMVPTLPELYSAANAIASHTQAIFVLKDNLIVSGIGTLVKVAAERHIPLITSDQGSVQEGAALALGVHENEIGVQGAILTAAVLKGQAPCSLPIVGMDKLTVFINSTALAAENQTVAPIQAAAQELGYTIEMIQHTDK